MPATDLRVLVVDDEADVREAVAALLEAFLDNPKVRQAASGGEGLRLLRSEGADLIVTDFRMPGMNGAQFLDQALQVAPGTPHVVITAFDREAVQSLGRSAATTHIVHKPFEPGHLLDVVDEVLAGAAS
jgi:CheY-like chemotaxis protein